MSKPGRLAIFFALLAAVTAAVFVGGAMAFVGSTPPTVNFAANHRPGRPVHLTIQTVGSIGYGVHPTWVSYLVQAPNGKWVHTTLWQLPAHTRIDVTIDQYDSGSPLRNQVMGKVTGVRGGREYINGHGFALFNANKGNGAAHTFTVPQLGINVPLLGVSGNAKNQCAAAPCTLSHAHNIIKFSFKTPKPGEYRWQCFVPCGLAYLYGNGGPMSTVGYMGGFLEVT